MRKSTTLYCTCGTAVGEEVFSHIDPRMRGFGTCDGSVYKHVYNGNEARTKDGRAVSIGYNQYMCKRCYESRRKI